MKTTLKTLLCAAAVALSATAQNSVWNYTALSEAPASGDKLFLYDTSASASKTLTIAYLLTSPALTGTPTVATSFTPVTNDAAALGSASLSFSDLFLASGGVVNIANGNWVATHTSGILTVGTGDLRVTTAGTNAASAVTVGGTQTLTNKTLTSPTMTTPTLGAAIATSIETLTSGLIFEGATANASETTLTAADPTADVTYLLPDAAAASYSLMSSTLATNAPDIANSVTGASAALVFEGTADAHETSLTATDATADRTITIPNATGTMALSQASTTTALTADNQAVTPGSNTVLQLTSDNATAGNRTFTLSATGAITGQIYVIIGPATNACEIADTGIQKLSATWSPGASDTLTLLFDGTNFTELARADN